MPYINIQKYLLCPLDVDNMVETCLRGRLSMLSRVQPYACIPISKETAYSTYISNKNGSLPRIKDQA